jgi:hypothetical protein
MTDLTDPQRALLDVLDLDGVRYLVIGGHAVRAHGVDRETQDLDLWVGGSRQNAKRINRAFSAFGVVAPVGANWTDAFSRPNALFAYPNTGPGKEADLLTTIAGVDFESCYARSVMLDVCGINLRVVGLVDLIELKTLAAGAGNDQAAHDRDQADVAALMAILNLGQNVGGDLEV